MESMPPSHPSHRAPSLVKHTRETLAQEMQAWAGLARSEWKWLITIAVGLLLLLAFSRPLPPRDVYFAVGQPGSTFAALGQKFVPYFAAQGIRLHLVSTPGSAYSLAELADRNVQVNAALMVGGIAAKGQFPGLVSLGSIEYVPLWLFYRGAEFKGKGAVSYFADKRVSIGPDGSATSIMLRKLLELSGIVLEDRPNLLRLPTAEAVQNLVAGEIDAVCIMDAIDSPNVRQLLQHPDLHIFNFDYAPAYVKKLPFLDTVVIPMGSLDLKATYPDQDIKMLASTATLLVERDTHPMVQQLFLLAADGISNQVDQFFAKPEFFPAYVDHSVTLSPVAKRFYEQGPPFLTDALPLWLVNYVNRIWLLIVGLVAVVYPLFKMFPRYRQTHSVMLITEIYEELQHIEQQAAGTQDRGELRALAGRIEELDAEARDTRISSEEMNRLYTMKGALNLIRQQIARRLQD